MDEKVNHIIATVAAMIFVAMQHREKSPFVMTGIAGLSGGLGYTLAPELAEQWRMFGPMVWTVLITAFGYAVLDVALALLSDRQAVAEIVKSRLGGGRK